MKDDPYALVSVFVVKVEKWSHPHYPYWEVDSMWNNNLAALNALESGYGTAPRKIDLRQLVLLSSGRVIWQDIKTVFEDGKWVASEYDPLVSDPEYQEYLRLMEKFKEMRRWRR